MWLDKRGPVVASTVYSDLVLVARDVSVTLPTVTPLSADVPAMGTMSLPIKGLLESMELSVTKIGVDLGLAKLSSMRSQNLEFRWVQAVVKDNGTTANEGCKAFVRAVPKGIPGPSLEVGSSVECEMTYEVTRYQLFVGGLELLLVDRLNHKLRVNGVDWCDSIEALL